MAKLDWRVPSAYRHIQDISPAGFAWEYLRRDDDYRRDFETITRDGQTVAPKEATFSRRWGARFRWRS